jgi:hypothetical protein
MTAHDATTLARTTLVGSQRSIRELVCPDIEEPLLRARVTPERRQCYRYARRLPGMMDTGTARHPVTCCDIGYGGIRVDTPGRVILEPGQRVTVRIDLHGRTFRDTFCVKQVNPAPEGTAVHLAL